MAPQQLLLEGDAAMLQPDAQFGAALGERGIDLAFEAADVVEQFGDLRRHAVAPSGPHRPLTIHSTAGGSALGGPPHGHG